MKTEEELEKAHDIFEDAVVHRLANGFLLSAQQLAFAMSAVCWVLGHDKPSLGFQAILDDLEVEKKIREETTESAYSVLPTKDFVPALGDFFERPVIISLAVVADEKTTIKPVVN